MEMMNGAASSVQSAASNTYFSMSETLQVHCQTVADRLLNYKYQDRSLTDTSPVYPETLKPVYILGEQWSAKHDLEELRDVVQSRLWFTYRRDFPCIGETDTVTDQGWGCMLRCGQMLVGSCLMDIHLTRQWRWSSSSWRQEKYRNILTKFQDKKSAPYSIHQIALMGESVESKPVGTWFGPNTVVQVLRKLVRMDPSNDLVIHVAMDNALILSEVRAACLSGEGGEWRPLLLCISLRLGLSEINPVYINGLKTCLSLPQTQGVLGGRPNHALYILGFVEDQAVYLDPHVTQPYVDIETWDDLSKQLNESELSESSVRTQSDACENPQDVSTDSTHPEHTRNDSTEQDTPEIDSTEGKDDFADMPADKAMVGQLELVDREDKSFHVIRPGRIDINQLDPSLSVTFLCKTEEDFDDLCIQLQEKLIEQEDTPLFEMMMERPPHMYPQTSNDISVQPDETTGSDYEKLDRKYDSEDEFEII